MGGGGGFAASGPRRSAAVAAQQAVCLHPNWTAVNHSRQSVAHPCVKDHPLCLEYAGPRAGRFIPHHNCEAGITESLHLPECTCMEVGVSEYVLFIFVFR